jgi:prepilin-type N-terminal cleavage/methylation domain-containing protein
MQKGFTLVELAIVMTIIGLLIGGILKGQELMQNARITATVSQVKSYSAAVTTFKDMYQATPGDMLNAGTRLVGCPGVNGVSCNPLAANAGDTIVGFPTWSTAWGAPGIVATSGAAAPANVDAERYLFWSHLLLANLIGGINADGLNNATPFAFDVTNPSAKIGGGFVVGYDTGVIGPGAAAGGQPANTGISGTILVQTSSPTLALSTTAGALPLAPLRAAQLDRKMDDGRPATGYVQAYGVGVSCFTAAASLVYNETLSSTDCGLIYRIEN